MSKTAGFSWGVKINDKAARPSDIIKHNKPKQYIKASIKKRRRDDEKKPRSYDCESSSRTSINKRAKLPIIKGEKLPVTRLIETLDKASVSGLLMNLIRIHPEIQSTIQTLHPKVDINDAMQVLIEKFDAISNNLPYKGDLENDYSYLRIKPYLNEFLNCLSDFILNYLPPNEINIVDSLKFIDMATKLIIKLPKFTNQEYKYINSKCHEQIANTWLIILHNLCPEDENNDEKLYNFVKLVNDFDLKNKLYQYNISCNNEFDKIIDLVNDRCKVLDNNNGLNDLITIDYSNYITANPSI